MQKCLIISVLSVFWTLGTAQDQADYIRKYQDLAVSEMVRTGIPASIKLAQAIQESRCGQSDLACKANNHFGIKCGGEWKGKSFHKEDDDYHNDKLVKSCFREFDSVKDSYIAHSDFLADPGKTGRYGSLFDLEITDYKGWATGLSKAGYATDPQYARRLIEIIEKYELFRFDNEYEGELASGNQFPPSGNYFIGFTNEVKHTLATKGDNTLLVARRFDINAQQLIRYNDDIFSKEQELLAGTKVYLEPKRNKYHGKQKYHVLKPGEDMVFVSQQHGIRLESLLKRNRLRKNEIVRSNQKIMLSGKLKKDLLRIYPDQLPGGKNAPPPKPSPFVKEPAVPSSADTMEASANSSNHSTYRTSANQGGIDSSHIVTKGDTLYGIARTYGLSVEVLKKRNNLSVDTIFIGQKLIVQ